MSRAPTATRQAEPEPAPCAWFLTGESFPGQQIVLTTTDPQHDAAGVPARWYERRQFVAGRWQRASSWVDPQTLIPLQPQPTHWRPDPARMLLEIPVA
jgi:hypothetical protein